MEANKLRIGNWIKEPIEIGGRIVQVERIDTDKDGYNHYLDHCNPIPLTEEWLLKFGFDSISEINSFTENYWNKNKDASIDVETFLTGNRIERIYRYVKAFRFKKN